MSARTVPFGRSCCRIGSLRAWWRQPRPTPAETPSPLTSASCRWGEGARLTIAGPGGTSIVARGATTNARANASCCDLPLRCCVARQPVDSEPRPPPRLPLHHLAPCGSPHCPAHARRQHLLTPAPRSNPRTCLHPRGTVRRCPSLELGRRSGDSRFSLLKRAPPEKLLARRFALKRRGPRLAQVLPAFMAQIYSSACNVKQSG